MATCEYNNANLASQIIRTIRPSFYQLAARYKIIFLNLIICTNYPGSGPSIRRHKEMVEAYSSQVVTDETTQPKPKDFTDKVEELSNNEDFLIFKGYKPVSTTPEIIVFVEAPKETTERRNKISRIVCKLLSENGYTVPDSLP